jgi:ferredoxin
VYVIVTLRAFFHMGSVECVTCQVPVRKGRGGAMSAGDSEEEVLAEVEEMWEGARSVTDIVIVRIEEGSGGS